jgi:8-oxo-dGTP diphosphatase
VLVDAAGRLLLAQRPAGKHLPLKWEFPGGKVEPGESPAAALRRELREELGCDVTVEAALPEFVHHYGTVSIHMLPFVCRLTPASAAPHPHEHIALRWVAPPDVTSLDLAEADVPVIRDYLAGRADPAGEGGSPAARSTSG